MRFLAVRAWAWMACCGMPHAWALPGSAAVGFGPTGLLTAAPGSGSVAALKLLAQAAFQVLLALGSVLLALRVAAACMGSAIASLPRTARIVRWAARSALAYRSLLRAFDDHEDDAFVELLVEAHTLWATRLAGVCRANGGVYVKLGQFACSFGAVPREYRSILSTLEDKATPRAFKDVEQYLLSELGASALVGPRGSGAVFSEFEEAATAAASLAQVHRAVLASGEEVAVKLQYPGLCAAVAADLAIVKGLARMTGRLFPEFSLGWLVDEMEAKLRVELDFRNEIHNANLLRTHLSAAKSPASVPIIHEELSTPRLIVMQWVNGVKLTDVETLSASGIDPRAVGFALVRLFGELMFVRGYVHADPHPGNVLVRPLGERRRWLPRLPLKRPSPPRRRRFELVLLDHGSHLGVPPELREQFCQLWCAFAALDKGMASDVSAALAGDRAGRILPALLTHQTRTRKEEIALQRAVGVNGFADMAQILSGAPRDLVELLRINTVIRASSNMLGVNMAERKRLFAWAAHKGLPKRTGAASHRTHVHPRSRSVTFRARLLLLLLAWSAWAWASVAAAAGWRLLLGLFGEVLFGD